MYASNVYRFHQNHPEKCLFDKVDNLQPTLQSLAIAHARLFVANHNAHPEMGVVVCWKVIGRGYSG